MIMEGKMSVTVIVGGQFGSEGKGKVAHFFAREQCAQVAIRVGGPNSGHTVVDVSGRIWILRQLPTASILPNIICIIPAGAYIDVDVLMQEVAITGLHKNRLLIDRNAVIISSKERASEKQWGLRESIGSTATGTGAAVIRRIRRDGSAFLAQHEKRLAPFIHNTLGFLRDRLQKNERILIEGTQGFGLSLLHSRYYPHATSRDTTAAGFISEAGLSPRDVDEIILVIRSFPIRVPGNSGPLRNETDWKTVSHNSGSKIPFIEYTSVTHRIRRVAYFDPEIVRSAIEANVPTQIVLNHLDYVDSNCAKKGILTERTSNFVSEVEKSIGACINYIGFNPISLEERNSYK